MKPPTSCANSFNFVYLNLQIFGRGAAAAGCMLCTHSLSITDLCPSLFFFHFPCLLHLCSCINLKDIMVITFKRIAIHFKIITLQKKE